MSVTYTIAGSYPDWDDPTTHLNLANVNASELLRWLDIEADELAKRAGVTRRRSMIDWLR